jgi:hypothetical protein
MTNSSFLELKSENWVDEAREVCRSAASGNLESRIHLIPKDSDEAELVMLINNLLDITDAYVRESHASLKAASEKRFYRKVVVRGLPGSFKQGAELINAEISHMEGHERTLNDALLQVQTVINQVDNINKDARLLAFNAMIEAARAGQYGSGFSVVATEMKKMSDRIGDAIVGVAEGLRTLRQGARS